MKTFALIFPPLENVHLAKDVGQIPYMMHRDHGYDVEIACRENSDSYPYLDNEAKGVRLAFINSPYRYLLKVARQKDVLMLFHISTQTICCVILYKWLNRKGIVYVKADINSNKIPYLSFKKKRPILKIKRRLLFWLFVRKVNFVSFECLRSFQQIRAIPDHKKLHLYNGFNVSSIDEYQIVRKPFDAKDDIIILVGRHGAPEKNTELFLKALSRLKTMGNWRVQFIGPMTPEFVTFKDEFLSDHQKLSKHLEFTGNIENKKELYQRYNDAKIFCLPSRSEGFPLTPIEALFFGCIPVMTRELMSSPDITNWGSAGLTAGNENPSEWAEAIQSIIDGKTGLRQLSESAKQHFSRNFVWSDIVNKLNERITNQVAK